MTTRFRAGSSVLFGNDLSTRVEDFVKVHEDTVLLHGHLAVFLKEEVERLSESTLTSGTKQVGLDAVDVSVATPDDTERLEEVAVDVERRGHRLSKLRHGRRRDVSNARSRTLEPGVGQDLSHLKNQ